MHISPARESKYDDDFIKAANAAVEKIKIKEMENIRKNISTELHDKATEIEKKALAEYITGNKCVDMYRQMELAKAFRLAANYLGNVAGGTY